MAEVLEEAMEMALRLTEDVALTADKAEALAAKLGECPSFDGVKTTLGEVKPVDIFESATEIFVKDADGVVFREGHPVMKFKGGEYTLPEHNTKGTGGFSAAETGGEGTYAVLPERVESSLLEITEETLGTALSEESKQALQATDDFNNATYKNSPEGIAREEGTEGLKNASEIEKKTPVDIVENASEITPEELTEKMKPTADAVKKAGKENSFEKFVKSAGEAGYKGVCKIFKFGFVLAVGFTIEMLYQAIHEMAVKMSGCWLCRSDGAMWKIVPLSCGEYRVAPDDSPLVAIPSVTGWGDMTGGGQLRPQKPNVWNPCPVNDYRYPKTAYCMSASENAAYPTCGGIAENGIVCNTGDVACTNQDITCQSCLDSASLFTLKDNIYYSNYPFPGTDTDTTSNYCRSEMLNTNDNDDAVGCDDHKCAAGCSNDTLYIPPDSNGMTYSLACIKASWWDAASEMLPDPLGGLEDLFGDVWNIVKKGIIIFVVIWMVLFFGKILYNKVKKN